MQQTNTLVHRTLRKRALALLLALALVLGLVPGFDWLGGETASAHWADTYLDEMVEWGLIRADQKENPDDVMTRADFMAIINRAYGYTKGGPIPFEDVQPSDWFYDDVAIAYNANYIYGTSPTTVSPNDPLTRETSATILGRNMMLKESEGEILDFSDAREISDWARGTIKSSLEHYLVNGYDDGTFRPQNDLTWGEMAAMVTRIVGMPIQEAGDYTLGGVFGNVTISSDGVTLRDSIISGDLYVTGGVGLGGIKLENVTVLGRIIASGSGESESGEASIVLRNVIADELLVDNLKNNFVTVRVDGVTEIGQTTVRTSSYLEDNTPEGLGLKNITLAGEMGTRLDLAGRIETVRVKTPNAQVNVAQGTVASMTVDEDAPDTNVTIARGAEVKELNLDIGAYVSGNGDIKKLNVNAPGAIVTMLPEQIYIRPGITAVINNQIMDSTSAEEASRDPQILSGYPIASDLAPTTFNAVFSTNKSGTIYWAVSPITDGSVDTEDLIVTPAFADMAVARGSLEITEADTLFSAPVGTTTTGTTGNNNSNNNNNNNNNNTATGLIAGGSYYLSAVLVDGRGKRSPTKVIALTMPDDSVPAFAEGYPQMSQISIGDGCVAVVMPNKTCKLYYALLPVGAKAPTETELRTNAVSGALGYGVLDVVKNTESAFRVDDRTLDEETEYVIYFWLVDANGVNKSAITTLNFTTPDETPPEFLNGTPTVSKVAANSVSLTVRLNEDGDVFWAVVPAGEDYPKPRPGSSQSDYTDLYAKLQVESALNALNSAGTHSITVKENTDGTINVTGLEPETAYDLWYVAKDTSGNYSYEVKMITIHTEDENPPTVRQSFSSTKNSQDPEDPTSPLPDTGLILTFSEDIRCGVQGGYGESLYTMYQDYLNASPSAQPALLERLVKDIRSCITLWQMGTTTPSEALAREFDTDGNDNEDWVIDYNQVQITRDSTKVLVTFPSAALNLSSGTRYYFVVTGITDTSTKQNAIGGNINTKISYSNANNKDDPGNYLPIFTPVNSQLYMKKIGITDPPLKVPGDGSAETNWVDVDFSFFVQPQATKNAGESCYDLLFFTDTTVRYNLYYRVVDGKGNPISTLNTLDKIPGSNSKTVEAGNGWFLLNNTVTNSADDIESSSSGYSNANGGKSLNKNFNLCTMASYPLLVDLNDDGNTYYQFAISLVQLSDSTNRDVWSQSVKFDVYAIAGQRFDLNSLTDNFNKSVVENFATYGAENIGLDLDSGANHLEMSKPFPDTTPPTFSSGYPKITVHDTYVDFDVTLSRDGTIYYVIAPRATPIDMAFTNQNYIEGTDQEIDATFSEVNGNLWANTPKDGTGYQPGVPKTGSTLQTAGVTDPRYESFLIAEHNYPDYIRNNKDYAGASGSTSWTEDNNSKGLIPNTDYYVYFVLDGKSSGYSDVYIYRFTTLEVEKPQIDLRDAGSGMVNIQTQCSAEVTYSFYTSTNFDRIADLKQPLSTYADPAKPLPDFYLNYNEDTSNASQTDAQKCITVLQALENSYNSTEAQGKLGAGDITAEPLEDDEIESSSKKYVPSGLTWNGYSIFDVYANERGKQRVAEIMTSSAGVAAAISPKDVSLTYNATINKYTEAVGNSTQTPLDSGTYYVLATAHHPSNNGGPAYNTFRILGNVIIEDTQPAEVYSVEGGITKYDDATSTYSGNISIVFDRDLFWLPRDAGGKGTPVYSTSKSATSADEWVSIMDVMSNSSYLTLLGGDREKSNTFSFSFSSLPMGITISLPNTGRISSESGNPRSEILEINLKYGYATTTDTPLFMDHYIEIKWGGKIINEIIAYQLRPNLAQP